MNRFMVQTNRENGWVVKLPYTTGRELAESGFDRIAYCKDLDRIVKALITAGNRSGERISYAVVQPCMKNEKGYRVVSRRYRHESSAQ